jgi:Ca-activated chloride channel homolog
MNTPLTGHWTHIQSPASQIMKDGFKGLLTTISVGLTIGTFLSIVILALILTSTVANAANTDALSNTKSGSLLVKNAQTGEYMPTPTLATDVNISVSGILSRTKVSQKFQNNSKDWVEGIYVFPLPENAAVDHLRMRIGDRIIEGQIKERSQAKKQFQAAAQSGKRAALIEQERPNVFTTSLTNIAPGESITVEIEYQNTLNYREGIVSLRFPLVVAPRYIPGSLDADEKAATSNGQSPLIEDAHRISPLVLDESEPKRNHVNLSIKLDAGFSIQDIQSTNHTIKKNKITDQQYTIRLASDDAPADRDFEITWRSVPDSMPRSAVYTEHKGDKHFALITLFPPTAPLATSVRLPRDVVFVVDTSGSMDGASLDQAKSALKMAVRRMSNNDRFNIIQFNDETSALFGEEQPASEKNLKVACRYINTLEANGGTNSLPALSTALNDDAKPGRIRQVVFITDGSVGNEDHIFSLIKKRLGKNRLFPIGIGSVPNSHLMTKIAEYGRGTFTYIGDISEVSTKMGEFFSRLENPVVTDIKTRWPEGFVVDTTPSVIPDLYQGEPLVIVAAMDETATGPLQIDGLFSGQTWSQTVNLENQQSEKGIGQVWARRKISEHMGLLRGGASEEAVREAVLGLALEHSLITKYSSLVAVDVTPGRTAQFMYRQLIPLNLPNRWSQAKIFGSLPQTATPSVMHLILAALFLLLASVFFVITRNATLARQA